VQTNWDNWIPIDQEQCLGTVAALPSSVRAACKEMTKLVYGDAGGCEHLCQETSDGRAEVARAAMAKLQPSTMNADSLMTVMSQPPVLNGGTQFTAIMESRSSSYRTLVREHGPSSGNMSAEVLVGTLMQLFKALVRHSPVIVV